VSLALLHPIREAPHSSFGVGTGYRIIALGFSHWAQANFRIAPQIRSPLLPNSFPINYLLIILPFDYILNGSDNGV
jgi:hypothetical protein